MHSKGTKNSNSIDMMAMVEGLEDELLTLVEKRVQTYTEDINSHLANIEEDKEKLSNATTYEEKKEIINDIESEAMMIDEDQEEINMLHEADTP